MSDPTDFTVPSQKVVDSAVEEFAKKRQAYVKCPPNLAGNEELVKKFHTVAASRLNQYATCSTRADLEEYLKDADAKWRVAQATENRYKTGSTQKENTKSHVSSGQFHKTVRLVSAGQRSIIFSQPDELPAAYAPYEHSPDYDDQEGKRIADGQNMYLRMVWNKEDWTSLIKSMLFKNVKNSMEFVTLEWDHTQEVTPERVPGWYDAKGKSVQWNPQKAVPDTIYDSDGKPIDATTFLNDEGMPTQFVFVDRIRTKRNWPVMTSYDMANVFFDLSVSDIQKSAAIIIRDQPTFADLLTQQKNAKYENVESLTVDQLFTTETRLGTTTKEDRLDNADRESEDGIANGLFDRYHGWMIAPISDWDDPKKAKWNDEAIPEIFEFVFVGPMGDAGTKNTDGKRTGAVCLQLRKIPYHHGEYPCYLLHSHPDDDTGLMKLGYYKVLECNIEEQTVTMDQWIDNKTLGIRSPLIAEEGNVHESNFMFYANKVVWVRPGTGKTALTKMVVPNYTQRTMEELGWLKNEADEIVGTLDAFKGEFAGARTTGTEYLGAREQSMAPAIEDTKTIIVPFLIWLLRGVAKLSRQFGPNDTFAVTTPTGRFIGEVNPTLLYGDLVTKITAIENFEANIVGRQILVNFIQAGGYDRAQAFMGKDGALYFWRTVANRLKLPEPERMFPESRPYVEAVNQANADYQYILLDPEGAMTNEARLPKQGEQHDIHIATLQPYRDRTALILPGMDDLEKEHYRKVVQALDLYIMLHEQLKEGEASQTPAAIAPGQPQAQLTAGAPGVPGQQESAMQATQTPEMEGEAAGNVMAGLGGQMGG